MDKGRQIQYLVACAVSLAAVAAGASLMWSTPVIPKFHNNETHFRISDAEISWMAAMSSPGYIAGSLLTRFASDKFGRQATLLGSALPIITGAIIILTSNTAWWLYITRFLWGSGTGMITTVSSVYLAEISDKEIRGTVSSTFRFMQSFGSFLIMTVGSFVSYQTLGYIVLVIPICYFSACFWIPETPYFYLKEGKVDAARTSLSKLSGNRDEKTLEEKLSAMREDVKKEMVQPGSLKELFTGKRYRKALIIAIGLKVSQVMSGLIAVQQYLGRIIQESNASINISTALIIFGAIRFTVGVLSSVIVDKVGRRPLLIYSYLTAGISLSIVGAYFLIQPSADYSMIPFIGIIVAMMAAITGFDTLAYIFSGEIFPLNVKSVAVTFLNILGGVINFTSVKGYQEMKNVAGLTGVFWFYSTFALFGAIFSYFVVIETKGKSLREIQEVLQGDLYDDNGGTLKKLRDDGEDGLTEVKLLKQEDS